MKNLKYIFASLIVLIGAFYFGANEVEAVVFASFTFASTTTFEDFLKSVNESLENFGKLDSEKQSNYLAQFNNGKFKALNDEIAVLKSQLNGKSDLTKEQKETLISELTDARARLKALEEAPKENANNGFKTVDAAIFNALVTNQDAIKKLREDVAKGNASPLAITIKNPVTIGTGNTIGAAEPMYQLTQDTGIISTIRSRELRYLAEVSVGSMASSRALWTEEIDEQGEPTFIGEGDDKAQASVLYDEKTKNVKKIAVFVKITMEMLDDLPQFVSFIMRNLERRLDLKIENQLFKGNDIGDNLKGSFGYATAFTGSDLVAQIENANEIDVIEAVALQVKKAHGTPVAIFINPTTMSKIKLIKDTTGRPVWKDYVTINNELNISGLKVVETEAVLADEFIGGDTKVINVLNRTGLQVQIGLDGNDLTKNKQTMVLEKRLVQFVSGNDTQLLVKGLFSTAKALIDKPTS